MSFVPYSCQTITESDIAAVTRVLRSEFLTQGPAVTQFETAFAVRHKAKYAVAVANATAGLHLACLALDVGPSSLVWTSPISFVASANCAVYCGAAVDFVDIDPDTRNMSVPALREKLELAAKHGALPSVVVPVDFSGLPCDLREIRDLANQYGFRILADASHATGASYCGNPIGNTFADITVFSFHAVKIVTTAEGGMVVTDDPSLAGRIRKLSSHGITRDAAEMQMAPQGAWYYEQQLLGFNYRLTDLQAALGVSQLTRLDSMQAQRVALADSYDVMLADLPLLLPARMPDRISAWHLYVIEIDDSRTKSARAEVFRAMREAEIGVNVHYIPIHTQPFYARMGFKQGAFPNAERYYRRAITLPLFPALSVSDQQRVVDALQKSLQ